MVKGESPIRSGKDLAGKTIAVNQVQGMNELTIRAVLARQGIDALKIKFLEVGFPEMTAALKSGRVDAISAVEPFVSSDYIAKNPSGVKRFARWTSRSPTPRATRTRCAPSCSATRRSRRRRPRA